VEEFIMIRFQKVSTFLLLAFFMGACAQGRKSYMSGKIETLFAPQELCENVKGDLLGCFSLEVNYTSNLAYVDVLSIDNTDQVTGSTVPYRVLARRDGDSQFVVLADGITTSAGQFFEVRPFKGHYIEEYVEWRFELVKRFATTNTGVKLGLEDAAPGAGLPIVQTTVFFPEVM
jgi:hypothetical protein